MKVLTGLFIFFFPFAVIALEPEIIESIKDQLRDVYEADQHPRLILNEKGQRLGFDHPRINELSQSLEETDAENQRVVAEILNNYGWPDADEFGTIEAGQTIFLVIQHADLEFQQTYIEMVREAVETGNVRRSSYALLEDRMRIRQGKKQLYGSQLWMNEETGQLEFHPIEDEENVDARREAIGLEPLAEYAKYFGLEY